ncbi:MAG: NAD(+) synthase [Bacteroidales bacterium]
MNSINISDIHDILIKKINFFVEQAGISNTVIGISGGIDSAVVGALAVEALGKEHVHGLLMPSDFSTLESVNDGVKLADNLGITYDVISISSIYHKFIRSIEPIFNGDNSWDCTQENLQARIRGTIIMAYSNRHKALVLNTSNKSVLSCGYGTLYGDLVGDLLVIADLYKTQVYELARYLNTYKEMIPLSTIVKAPSAELRPGQKDSDSLPDYNIMDQILFKLNEENLSVSDIIKEGFDADLVKEISKLRAGSSFKNAQLAPVIKIGKRPIFDKSKWI